MSFVSRGVMKGKPFVGDFFQPGPWTFSLPFTGTIKGPLSLPVLDS